MITNLSYIKLLKDVWLILEGFLNGAFQENTKNFQSAMLYRIPKHQIPEDVDQAKPVKANVIHQKMLQDFAVCLGS